MTAQIHERLYYKTKRYGMTAEPLAYYWGLVGSRPRFQLRNTALWRGYIGSWRVTKDRLYLIGLEGGFEDGSKLTLEALFPGCPERVFAHWFSGQVRLPQGNILEYVHAGYASVYEADLFLGFEDGVLVREELKSNLPEAKNL
jgi:hypothetical protein